MTIYGTSFFEEEVEEIEENVLLIIRKEQKSVSSAVVLSRLSLESNLFFRITTEHINKAFINLVVSNKICFLSGKDSKISHMPEIMQDIVRFIKRLEDDSEEMPNFEMVNDHFRDRQKVKFGLFELVMGGQLKIKA